MARTGKFSRSLPPLTCPRARRGSGAKSTPSNPTSLSSTPSCACYAGTMGEEESWASIKLLIRKISSRRIAKFGCTTPATTSSKRFGTKTREWEMDTVVSLTTAEGGQALIARHHLHRRRHRDGPARRHLGPRY